MDSSRFSNYFDNYNANQERMKMEIQDVLFWLLFVVTVVVILWFILGKSPTLEQGLLILILTLVINNSSNIKGLKEKMNNMENRFSALASDFKTHIKHK